MKKFIYLLWFGAASMLNAQTTNIPPSIFQAYYAVADAPLLRGNSVIGALNNQISFPVEIRAEALTNLLSSNVVYAVSLRTKISAKETEVDYVDYDELDGLIRGVQFVSQTDHSQIPMDNFEAVYRTRCGMSILKTSTGNKVTIVLKSGDPQGARNQMASFVLDDLGRYLTAAKAKLDAMVSVGQ